MIFGTITKHEISQHKRFHVFPQPCHHKIVVTHPSFSNLKSCIIKLITTNNFEFSLCTKIQTNCFLLQQVVLSSQLYYSYLKINMITSIIFVGHESGRRFKSEISSTCGRIQVELANHGLVMDKEQTMDSP